MEVGFEFSVTEELCHFNSSEPQFPQLGNGDHYTKLVGAFKIKSIEIPNSVSEILVMCTKWLLWMVLMKLKK